MSTSLWQAIKTFYRALQARTAEEEMAIARRDLLQPHSLSLLQSQRRDTATKCRELLEPSTLVSPPAPLPSPLCPTSQHPTSTIATLPTELLELIFIHLAPSSKDLHSVRLTSRAFRDSSWKPFAQTFNARVFHLTPQSVEYLLEFASNRKTARHLKTLCMSTVGVCFDRPYVCPLPIDLWEGMGEGDVAVWFEDLASSGVKGMFLEALGRLKWLEEIVVVEGGGIPSDSLSRIASELKDFQRSNPHSHRDTLHLIHSALHIHAPPSLKSLRTEGRMRLSALPTPLTPPNRLPHITRLDLALTVDYWEPNHAPHIAALPAFLQTFPHLTSLALAFPRPDFLMPRRHQLFGNTGFDIITTTLHLPQLSSLHFSHLSLNNAGPLQNFLQAHSSALRKLNLTTLGLTPAAWRPFAVFLKKQLQLDWLVMDDDLDEAEKAVATERWSRYLAHMPRRGDFERVARCGTRWLRRGELEKVGAGLGENEEGEEVQEQGVVSQ